MIVEFALRFLFALCVLDSIYRKGRRVRKENAEDTFMQNVLLTNEFLMTYARDLLSMHSFYSGIAA